MKSNSKQGNSQMKHIFVLKNPSEFAIANLVLKSKTPVEAQCGQPTA